VTFAPVVPGTLVAQPGSSTEIKVGGTIEGLGTDLAGVPGAIDAELRLDSVIEGILVSGILTGVFSLRCARCLDGSDRPFTVNVSELFVVGPATDPDCYELGPDGEIDLGPMIVDAIGLELPFAPLCRPDCLGLCETCGGNRNLGQCPGHEQLDPRWAALGVLLEHAND
jgi:uncharacterized protein